eukprot:gnl/MRDRNA2_/MRDRNA2_126767_c0_seq1.p1 gnl/MRDRNA2_/MRDRNA2_126767_c0~~gnl/MRDRNA2_/MRDRNA2_126767_c0_seq1.p1  ORF type:complete len:394 (-),score=58.40 gnl/MRDRNA2_/MRDRNA2_126767_c0_seq1:429-1610(-)
MQGTDSVLRLGSKSGSAEKLECPRRRSAGDVEGNNYAKVATAEKPVLPRRRSAGDVTQLPPPPMVPLQKTVMRMEPLHPFAATWNEDWQVQMSSICPQISEVGMARRTLRDHTSIVNHGKETASRDRAGLNQDQRDFFNSPAYTTFCSARARRASKDVMSTRESENLMPTSSGLASKESIQGLTEAPALERESKDSIEGFMMSSSRPIPRIGGEVLKNTGHRNFGPESPQNLSSGPMTNGYHQLADARQDLAKEVFKAFEQTGNADTTTAVTSGAQLANEDAFSDVSDPRDSEHDNQGSLTHDTSSQPNPKFGKFAMQRKGNQDAPSPISSTDLPPTGSCRSPRVPRRRRSTGSAVHLGPRSARRSSETDVTDVRIARWMQLLNHDEHPWQGG